MTKVDHNKLLLLTEQWIKEAEKKGIDTDSVRKALRRINFMAFEIVNKDLGPNIDQINT